MLNEECFTRIRHDPASRIVAAMPFADAGKNLAEYPSETITLHLIHS